MKVLISYAVFGEEAAQALERSINLNFGVLPDYAVYNKLVVTDRRTPLNIPCATIRSDGFWRDGFFNVSAARNAALEYAEITNMDWAVILDADGILLDPIHNDLPDLTKLLIHYMEPGVDLECWVNTGRYAEWDYRKEHYLILSRSAFTGNRYCEKYRGWGCEDSDFIAAVLYPEGFVDGDAVVRSVHLIHPNRDWYDFDDQGRLKNRHILRSRVLENYLLRGTPIMSYYFDEKECEWFERCIDEYTKG